MTYKQACEYYDSKGYDMATLHDSYCDSNDPKAFDDWLIHAAMKEIANKYDYGQVIIIARKVDSHEHVTTYGKNKEHCTIAARCGAFLKYKVMGWYNEN